MLLYQILARTIQGKIQKSYTSNYLILHLIEKYLEKDKSL